MSTVRPPGPDSCPGALRLHAAADGPLARVRLPGGMITGGQLAALGRIAEAYGDGHLELTSRANLQVRALTGVSAGALAEQLRRAALLPSDTHETVRNILASPLSGRAASSRLDVRPLVAALDRGLCDRPRLAQLPGRFLFALDDGHGDVAPGADLALVPAGDRVTVLFAGVDAGLRLRLADAVPALLAGADAFLDERAAQGGTAWRLAELVDGPPRVAARTAAALGVSVPAAAPPQRDGPPRGVAEPAGVPTAPEVPVGVVPQPDGLAAVGALVPLGRLGGVPLRVLSLAAHLVVTPWRAVLVPDLAPARATELCRALAGAGLAVTAGSRWAGVSACAGRPGCGRALADVRAAAGAAARPGGDLPVHWIGCERGCGSPTGAHVRVRATTAGYEITAPAHTGHAAADEVADRVAAARRS